jgi:hypothetical protein
MVMNIIKAGGYVMILSELINQVNEARRSRAKALRRNRTKNMVIGAGIGTAVGVTEASCSPQNQAKKQGKS